MRPLKQIGRELFNSILLKTGLPYELKRKIPPDNFDCVKLALAYYQKLNPELTLVQIGACDGVSGDPIYDIASRGKIKAVLVEPVESSFIKLKKAYSSTSNIELIQAAIADQDGSFKLYKVKDSGRWTASDWTPQFSSFSRQHLISLGIQPEEIEEITVRCMTLKSLMAQSNLGRIDFLQVDTEGYDAVIVQMALNLPHPPDCINFESVHIKQEARDKLFLELHESGYSWINYGLNTLALHSEFIRHLTHQN